MCLENDVSDQVECTCLTATRWQSLKSCLCCTGQPEENDEPAADYLDCHKSHQVLNTLHYMWSVYHDV